MDVEVGGHLERFRPGSITIPLLLEGTVSSFNSSVTVLDEMTAKKIGVYTCARHNYSSAPVAQLIALRLAPVTDHDLRISVLSVGFMSA